MSQLLRGSAWNVWDLHIHTPFSIEEKYSFEVYSDDDVWEKFINCLEKLPSETKVIGINDYYFIDGYEKVMNYKLKQGRLQNIEKVFPILEFRIDTFAANGSKFSKINFHVLFNINEEKFEDEIKKIKNQFINQIHVTGIDEYKTLPLSKESFEAVGSGNLKDGFNNFVPPTKEVLDILKANIWKDNTFTFLGYSEWNGLETDRDNQLKPYKKEMYEMAGAFFTSNANDIPKKRKILEQFGNKVILHSLDIHSFKTFAEYKCMTWVKADCTFEGLKQILIEPEQRVILQENNPRFNENKTSVIDSIDIKEGLQWFQKGKLPLNDGLVSIIGEKGSGKTALLDLLAVANGEGIYEKDQTKPYSFYNRAKDDIIGLEMAITYLNGSPNNFTFNGNKISTKSDKNAKVRYISLKELEGYCEDKNEFQNFIKDIVLSTNPNIELFDEKSTQINSRIEQLNFEIDKVYLRTKDIATHLKAVSVKRDELESHLKNEPQIKTNFSEAEAKIYNDLLESLQSYKTEKADKVQEKLEIESILTWIEDNKKNYIQSFKNILITKSNTLKYLDKNLIAGLKFEITTDIQLLKDRVNVLENDIKVVDTKIKETLDLVKPFEEANKSLNDEKNIIKIWIESKSRLTSELSNLEKTVDNLQKDVLQMEELQKQVYFQYLDLVKNKIGQREEYHKLKRSLESDSGSSISFNVDIEYNVENFFQKENLIINHGQGYGQEVIKQNLINGFLNKLNEIYTKKCTESLDELLIMSKEFYSPNFISAMFGEKRNIDNILKQVYKTNDFYNWIFSDYFEVNYTIFYKKKPLDKLSPGQKGLVLMKMFLRLDRSNKPLLIDQPEDNLDNKSVYNDLVNDIKDIKKKRQVIIATHNPNLVVNTDSEQVIIASFEDNPTDSRTRITYESGSLEDIGIRTKVCQILEGGELAFKKREQKYDLKN